MKKCLVVLGGFLAAALLPLFAVLPVYATETADTISAVIISEVKLGGSTGSDNIPSEFVSLFNLTDNAVPLDGWKLEYINQTSTPDGQFNCQDADWSLHSSSKLLSMPEESQQILPHQAITLSTNGRTLNNHTDGSIHLVDNSGVVQDLVGWGESAPCSEGEATTTPPDSHSIARYLDCARAFPADSNNNGSDFTDLDLTNPEGSNGPPSLPACQNNEDADSGEPSEQLTTCEGVAISELLPNPAGTDTSHEFIELYNPTDSAISLSGCSLQTSASSKTYNFGSVSLKPDEYRTFYDSITGLTLPNSSGGTVWLLTPTEELQTIAYPGDLDDNASWALADSSWQATYKPTPGATNVIEETKPCPAGQKRSPETGYCRNVVTLTTSTLGACPAGKVRNPATNRCRSITSSSSSLTPCKPGQTRNPATHRCKAIATLASASLKPCAPGQERNPATHRCRKITSANASSNLANVKDVASGSIASSPHWLLAGLAIAGATSYGIYEWRQEALQFLSRLRTKFPKVL